MGNKPSTDISPRNHREKTDTPQLAQSLFQLSGYN